MVGGLLLATSVLTPMGFLLEIIQWIGSVLIVDTIALASIASAFVQSATHRRQDQGLYR
jgi:hypothetical protein